MQILLAMAREADRRAVARALRGSHRTVAAADVATARRALDAGVDAVMLDAAFARPLARALRATRAAGPGAVAVLVVAGARDANAARLLGGLADDLVRRPLDAREIRARIAALRARRDRERRWDSGDRLRLALAAGEVAVWEWDVGRGALVWWREEEVVPGAGAGVAGGDVADFFDGVHPDDRVTLAEAVRDAAEDGHAFDVEFRRNGADGVERWLAIRGRPRRDARGEVTHLVGLAYDVTGRRHAQEAVAASEERFRALVEHSAEVIVVLDSSGRVVYGSRGEASGTGGLDAAPWLGQHWSFRMHPEDVDHGRAVFAAALASPRTPFTITLRVEAPEGGWRWVESRVRNLLDHPHVRGIVVNARDVTARMEAEAALRIAELRQRQVAEVASDFAFTSRFEDGEQPSLEWVSDAFPRITGYTLDEMRARGGLHGIWHPGDQHLYGRALRRVRDGESAVVEARALRPDGATYWLRTYARPLRDRPDGPVVGVYGAAQDVTDVQRLAEERQRLASVLDATTDFVALADTSQRILYLNRAARRALGSGDEADAPAATTLADCHPPWAATRLDEEGVPTALARGHWYAELAWRSADGPEIPVSQVLVAHRGASGRAEFLAVIARDIREHRELERALRQQAAQLEEQAHLLDLAHVLIRDGRGVVRFWNRGAEQLYGWTAPEAVGRPVHELLRTEFPAPRAEIERVFAATGHWEGKLVHTTRDGRRLVVASHWVLHRDAEGRPASTIEVNNDITALERLRDDLASSREELRALSAHLQEALEEERTRIAREIHDEMGQLLTGLKMDLSWLGSRLDKEQNRDVLVEKARAMGGLVDAIVRAVRRTATALRPLVLDDLGLVAALEWQAHEFSARTGIRCDFRPDEPGRRYDRPVATALFRIAQEALTNVARHAGAQHVAMTLRRGDGRLVLEVDDDGRGIAVPARGRRGLGLLGMEERARLLGGDVSVGRRPQGGTRVVASVPVPATSSAQAADSPSTSRMP